MPKVLVFWVDKSSNIDMGRHDFLLIFADLRQLLQSPQIASATKFPILIRSLDRGNSIMGMHKDFSNK